MINAMMGQKIGMTQTFTVNGDLIPITVIKVTPSLVLRVKTKLKDGYDAVQLGFDPATKTQNRPDQGQFQSRKQPRFRCLYEVRGGEKCQTGTEIKLGDVFTSGMRVDVVGTSKGLGFTGVIKKDNQSRGPKSHGSHHYRRVGSRGAIAPNRIFKGSALPGRWGNRQVTAQGLTVVKVDPDQNLLILKGSTPGPQRGRLLIKKSLRTKINPTPIHLFDRGLASHKPTSKITK